MVIDLKEIKKPVQPSQAVTDQILEFLDHLRKAFHPETKIMLLIRNPMTPEGNTILTDDHPRAIMAALFALAPKELEEKEEGQT